MATVNGFEMSDILDVILMGGIKMDNEELFAMIKSHPPVTEVGQVRTKNELLQAIDPEW